MQSIELPYFTPLYVTARYIDSIPLQSASEVKANSVKENAMIILKMGAQTLLEAVELGLPPNSLQSVNELNIAHYLLETSANQGVQYVSEAIQSHDEQNKLDINKKKVLVEQAVSTVIKYYSKIAIKNVIEMIPEELWPSKKEKDSIQNHLSTTLAKKFGTDIISDKSNIEVAEQLMKAAEANCYETSDDTPVTMIERYTRLRKTEKTLTGEITTEAISVLMEENSSQEFLRKIKNYLEEKLSKPNTSPKPELHRSSSIGSLSSIESL
jgi:hypothetical protein